MSQDYEKYYIPRNLAKNRIVFFDSDDFFILVAFIMVGLISKHILVFSALGLMALNAWRRIKSKEHNMVKNLRYKFLGTSVGLKSSPSSYKKHYYG